MTSSMCEILHCTVDGDTFDAIKTLKVSFLDTPRFDNPVVTGLGEGDRQKIPGLCTMSLTGVLYFGAGM